MSPELTKIRDITVDEQRRRLFAKPTWETMFDLLNMISINNPDQHGLLIDNRDLLREYFEAVVSSSCGSYRRMRRFKKEYMPNGENPKFSSRLNWHMGFIRSRVLGQASKRR